MNKKYGFVAQLEEHYPEKVGVDDSISSEAINIKIGDYIEFGKREWATWKLAKIINIEENTPHWNGRTKYDYVVLAYNHEWTSTKGKFYSGAPIFRSPMKKIEFNDLPKYIGAPKITKYFEKVFKEVNSPSVGMQTSRAKNPVPLMGCESASLSLGTI